MGRKRGALWDHFETEYHDASFSTKRTRCQYCHKSVSSTTYNMKTHITNCTKIPSLDGLGLNLNPRNASVTPSIARISAPIGTVTIVNNSNKSSRNPVGRKRGALWDHFEEQYRDPNFAIMRTRCKYCRSSISTTTHNMKTHLAHCSKLPSFPVLTDNQVDAVTASTNAVANIHPGSNGGRTKSALAEINTIAIQGDDRSKLHSDKNAFLDQRFTDAILETGTDVRLFEHPAWQAFFEAINPLWSMPSANAIHTTLLEEKCKATMVEMIKALSSAPAVVLGLDSSMSTTQKEASAVDVFAYEPKPWFLERLQCNLYNESSTVVVKELVEILSRLREYIQKQQGGIAFVSDSSDLMCDVRRELLDDNYLDYVYGCCAHALNEFCWDILNVVSIKSLLRMALFVAKCVRNRHSFASGAFSDTCEEQLNAAYTMVLYSSSRWISVYYMFRRLRKVKAVLEMLPMVTINEQSTPDMNKSDVLPDAFKALVSDHQFWNGVTHCIDIFDPICKCISLVESDASTMASAYACFVYMYMHINKVTVGNERIALRKSLLAHWKRIYSPVHALAFFCDPFYGSFRVNVATMEDRAAIELGYGDVCAQCRTALRLLTRRDLSPDEAYERLLIEFMEFCMKEEDFTRSIDGIRNYQPRLIWSQARDKFPLLSSVLVKIYSGPGSSSGVHRQHQMTNSGIISRRYKCKAIENQFAIAHNSSTARLVLSMKRQPFEHVIAAFGEVQSQHPKNDEEEEDQLTMIEQSIASLDSGVGSLMDSTDPVAFLLNDSELAEQEELNRAVFMSKSPVDIPDDILFDHLTRRRDSQDAQ